MSNANTVLHSNAGDEPLTWYDKLKFEQQMIVDAEQRDAERAWTDGTAHLQRLEDYALKVNEAVLAEYDVLKHAKPDSPEAARTAKRKAAAVKRREDYKAARAAELATKTGDKYQALVDGIQELQRRGKRLETFGISDTLAEGQRLPDRTAELADAYRANRAQFAATVKLPRPADEVADAIADGVERAAADMSATARRVCRGHWVGDRNGGHYEASRFEFPTTSIPNGLGGLSHVLDVGALLTLFESDIKAKLTALALEGHNAAAAIPMAERLQRLADLDAEALMIQRKHEFWIRQGCETGENAGPRICGEDIRPILDIK